MVASACTTRRLVRQMSLLDSCPLPSSRKRLLEVVDATAEKNYHFWWDRPDHASYDRSPLTTLISSINDATPCIDSFDTKLPMFSAYRGTTEELAL